MRKSNVDMKTTTTTTTPTTTTTTKITVIDKLEEFCNT